MNSNLVRGEVVFLAANHEWGRGGGNPLTCFGRVDYIDEDNVAVTWANGRHNSYEVDGTDLMPVVYRTREMARAAARRNPNVFVFGAAAGFTTLMIRRNLVVEDE